LSDVRLDGIGEDREVFCHRSNLPKGVDCLEQGARCEFELVPPHKPGKPVQAKIIRVVKASEAA
jgi:cold shock CspA family protein